MRPPGFVEALGQGLVGRLEEDEPGRDLGPDRPVDPGKICEEARLADVNDQGRPVYLNLLPLPEVDEIRDELGRQVVHAVIAEVLEGPADDALPRTRQAGDDEEASVLGGAAHGTSQVKTRSSRRMISSGAL